MIERQIYPLNAKYYQKSIGNFNSIQTRTVSAELLDATAVLEVEQFIRYISEAKKNIL